MAKTKLSTSTESSPEVEVEVERLPEDVEVSTAPEANMVQVPMPAPEEPPMYDKTYLDACQNLSQKIRYLSSRGLTTSQIVKVLKYNAHGGPLIYQHVRNILLQRVKKTA